MDQASRGRPPMDARLKLIIRCAAGALALTVILYIAFMALNSHRAAVSRKLVGELQRLEIGKTTEKQVKQLSEQYGGKYSPASSENPDWAPANYEISVSSPYITVMHPASNSHGPARTLPGLRPWLLSASLEVEHGYLKSFHLWVSVCRSDGSILNFSVSLTDSSPVAGPNTVPYYVSEALVTGSPGEAMVVELSSIATAEERKKALGINFSCFTGFRECAHVCNTMPAAWGDLRGRLTNQDGSPVNDYKECGKATP